MSQFEHITTEPAAQAYESTNSVFSSLLSEVRELSKKKPEATLSAGKVRIINRVLADLLAFLQSEPEGKYLEQLDDESLPQVSDALLVMVQFKAALDGFYRRYFNYVFNEHQWITAEKIREWKKAGYNI